MRTDSVSSDHVGDGVYTPCPHPSSHWYLLSTPPSKYMPGYTSPPWTEWLTRLRKHYLRFAVDENWSDWKLNLLSDLSNTKNVNNANFVLYEKALFTVRFCCSLSEREHHVVIRERTVEVEIVTRRTINILGFHVLCKHVCCSSVPLWSHFHQFVEILELCNHSVYHCTFLPVAIICWTSDRFRGCPLGQNSFIFMQFLIKKFAK